MTPPAYRLQWNHFDHRPDDIICRIVEFPGWNTNTGLAGIRSLYQPSEPIRFDTHFELLQEAPDYPNNTPDWPVMSHRMLEVLRSVGEFDHHVTPVTLVQDTIPVEVRYDADGRPRPEYSKSDYVAVQLTSYADVFDEERSSFQWNPMFPDRAIGVDEFVFRVPPDGLPPLFRLYVHPVVLFVSTQARNALDDAGIRGPVYVPPDQLFISQATSTS